MTKHYKKIVSIIMLLVFVCLTACVNTIENTEEELMPAVVPEGTLRMDIEKGGNGRTLIGFGVQWDPHLFTKFNDKENNPQIMGDINPIEEEDWILITERAKKMRFHNIRMMMYPEWFEPENDNGDSGTINWDGLNFQTRGMLSVKRILDFCQQNNVDVNVTFWGPNANLSTWNSMPWSTDFSDVPANIYEYAESMAIFVKWCTQNGYTCVKELTPYNEPDWAYKSRGNGTTVSMEDYAEMCKALHDRLIQEGIRDKILLNLSDSTQTEWSKGIMNLLESGYYKGVADVYNSHNYLFNYSTPPSIMVEWSKGLVAVADKYNKLHMLNEFGVSGGTDSHNTYGIEMFERGLFLAQLANSVINGGSVGMCYWELHDMIYHIYDYKMQLGLWGFKDENWRIRKQYYAYSLLTRYTEKGSTIYPIISDSDNISAAAYRNKDGKWTIIVTNKGIFPQDISFVIPDNKLKNLNKYEYLDSTLPKDGSDDLLPCVGVAEVKSRVLTQTVKGNSMVVFTELD